ncbi:MAG: hypothetical protein ACK49X_14385 [Akkermansiaceae bacterium]|jgi:hypothetical protein
MAAAWQGKMDQRSNQHKMSDGPKYEPHEFFPVLEKLPQAVGEVVICGGQAVNLLAAVFLTEGQLEKLLGRGNVMSADMDLVITKALQRQIVNLANKSQGFSLKTFADCRQPIQFAIMPNDMPDTRIDVMRSINGIHTEKDRVFEDAIDLDNSPYLVINPTTLLIAKAENCATLEQDSPTEKRNDIKHLQLLIPIVHNYLQKLVLNCDPESKSEQRDIMRFLKSIHAASKKTNFQKGMKLAQVKLYDAIPIARIRKSKLKILQSYLEQTFLGNPSMPPT